MTTIVNQVTKLSHKAFRALLKKFRRKKKRQQIAASRAKQEEIAQKKRENSPNFQERQEEHRRNSALWEEYQEREKQRKHKQWLLREQLAQTQFYKKQKFQEEEKIRKEEERKKMLAELEERNLVEIAALEETTKAKEKKEEVLQEALSGLPEGNEPWHNPIAPEHYNIGIEREQCLFFAKTGCCRFGERCSRGHPHPDVSCTILIRGMYSHYSIEQTNRDDYDTDMALEFEDSETYSDFKDFYNDVLPEFKSCGKVVQFKVCSNHEPHLRGNVYVQYAREEHAVEAFKKFNGRFYAGKQISCEFTNVLRWKSAICGLYNSKKCPKGNNCNFLHVFRNPNNEFWASDRDLPERRWGDDRRSNHRQSQQQDISRYRFRDYYYERSRDRERSYSRHSSSSRRKRRYSSDDSDSEHPRYTDRQLYNNGDTSDTSSRKKLNKRREHSRSERRSSSSSSATSISETESTPSKKKKKHKKSKKRRKRKISPSGSESN